MIEQLLSLLQSINSHLNSPFWKEYGFYLGILNCIVLAVTLWYLSKYTNETEQTRKQIARQTELEQMPIMLLFIRSVADGGVPYGELQNLIYKFRNFLIRVQSETEDSNYFLRVRNTGKGTAFNVMVESDVFDILDYETQFFAPLADEHSIKIIQKGGKKIESWEMFENSVFTIKCDDLSKNSYEFKYKILNFKERKIEYLGQGSVLQSIKSD
ncbi:MAG: hypothetical protein WC472_04130 [Candidatus Paceibacterota bacterium]